MSGGTAMIPWIVQSAEVLLDVGQAPKVADCIFVHAGRPERKVYGLELFRQGYARRIVFSVGRFEWRRFARLGLGDDGGLAELVERTSPAERYFFVVLDEKGTRALLVRKNLFGTLSEATALSELVESEGIRTILVVSSRFHLRRACDTLRQESRKIKPEIIPVAVPVKYEDLRATVPYAGLETISRIGKELLKYALYRVVTPFHSRRWAGFRNSG